MEGLFVDLGLAERVSDVNVILRQTLGCLLYLLPHLVCVCVELSKMGAYILT